MLNTDILTKIQAIILACFVFLLPLFFLPITRDFYDLNKQMLLLFVTVILTVMWFLRICLDKKIELSINSIDALTLGLGVLFSLSTIFQSQYKIGSLLAPLGTFTVICSIALYFAIKNMQIKEEKLRWIEYSFIAGGTAVSIMSILWLSGLITPYMKATFLKDKFFTPFGPGIMAMLYLIIVLAVLIPRLFNLIKRRSKVQHSNFFVELILFVLLTTINASALILNVVIHVKQGINILPYNIGWAIILETWKAIPSLFFGFGPGNFLGAFSMGKPAFFNQLPNWNLMYLNSSSFLFTLGTEVGLPAVIVMCFILLKIIQPLYRKKIAWYETFVLPTIAIIILHFVTISSVTLLIMAFVFLSMFPERTKPVHVDLAILGKSVWILLLFPLIISAFVLFLANRVYIADMYYKTSLDAIAQNNGDATYAAQSQAIKLNPYSDIYRRGFSQTNLSIANAISAKKTVSDQDKQNIPRLIQQSINDAKSAVLLNRLSIVNWYNLATIYSAIIGFANGAEQSSIQAYQQIITLSPSDPQARLSLGGIYYSMKRYDDAINYFSQAISVKPNYANAHYNLSHALSEKKNYNDAYKEMQQVVALLPEKAPDAVKAKKELEDLKKSAETTASATPVPEEKKVPEQLSIPSPRPTVSSPSPTAIELKP